LTRFSSVLESDRRELSEELAPRLRGLEGTTLVVTGSNGFLCSYLLDMIAGLNDYGFAKPCRVIGIDNLKSGISTRTEHLSGRPDFEFLHADVSRDLAYRGPADWIIHGASIASPTFYRQYPLETIDANVGGTRTTLELARRSNARSFLFLSSSEIYGDPDPAHIPTAEDFRGFVSCTGPRACYDESKRLGETLTMTYYRLHQTPVKTIRPFNVYGPGQRIDDRRIIPDLMSAALERHSLVLLSDGRATRAFCYALDFIRALLLILVSNHNGEVFNVGNDEAETSMSAVAETMSEVAGEPRLPVEHRTSDDRDYLTDNPTRRCPDLTKLRTSFDWSPRVPLREGLRRTLDSYRELRTKGFV
jgi:dTDP-glucose 4,6-dehydratase/UDP-glucuronate decarboxylase